MTADMSVAPEIARLINAAPQSRQTAAAPAQPSVTPCGPDPTLTLGSLARHLRLIAATPERWWELVRFEPDRSVKISVEERPSFHAWLMVLPPGDPGDYCDCDVATMVAGEPAEGDGPAAALRPGALRVHGPEHWLRGRGAGYSVSLHARAHPTRGNKLIEL